VLITDLRPRTRRPQQSREGGRERDKPYLRWRCRKRRGGPSLSFRPQKPCDSVPQTQRRPPPPPPPPWPPPPPPPDEERKED
jgi:hypothetical protein